MRVIHILSHSLSQFRVKNADFAESAWHIRFAKEVLKLGADYSMECWQPEVSISRVTSWDRGDMAYKSFPSCRLPGGREWSTTLLQELKRQLAQEEILVHVYGVFNPILYAIAYSCHGAPLVVSELVDGWPWLAFQEGIRYRRVKPIIGHLGFHFVEYLPLRLALRNIDHLFVLNKHSCSYASKLIGPDKVEVRPPGIDFNRFRPGDRLEARMRLGLEADKHYILYVGLLLKLKGLEYLLKALPQVRESYPESVILMVGDGYHRDKLESLSKVLGVNDNVKFLGYIDNASEQLPLLYNAADVCVMPSWHQAFSITGVEALACNSPFIGTDVGGVPELVENFEAGVLVAPRNPHHLAQAIIRCFNSSHEFKANREQGEHFYGWDGIAQRVAEIYYRLFESYYSMEGSG